MVVWVCPLDKTHYTSSKIYDSIARLVGDVGGDFAQDIKRMKGITSIASKRKHLAADMIQQSMIDEEYRFHNDKEMHPRYLQTADMWASLWRANNWDLRLLAFCTSLVIATSTGYIGRTIYRALQIRAKAVRR